MLPAEFGMPGIEHEAGCAEQLHMCTTYGPEDRHASTELRWCSLVATHTAQVAEPDDALAIMPIEPILLRGCECFPPQRHGAAIEGIALPEGPEPAGVG